MLLRLSVFLVFISCGCNAQEFETAEPFGRTVSASLVDGPLTDMAASIEGLADNTTPFVSVVYAGGNGVSFGAVTPGIRWSANQIDFLIGRIDPGDAPDLNRFRVRYKRVLLAAVPATLTGVASYQKTEHTSQRLQLGLAADRKLSEFGRLNSLWQLVVTGNLSAVKQNPVSGTSRTDALVSAALALSSQSFGFAVEYEAENDINGDDLMTVSIGISKYLKASVDDQETFSVGLFRAW